MGKILSNALSKDYVLRIRRIEVRCQNFPIMGHDHAAEISDHSVQSFQDRLKYVLMSGSTANFSCR